MPSSAQDAVPGPLRLRRLLPPGASATVEEIVDELELTALAERGTAERAARIEPGPAADPNGPSAAGTEASLRRPYLLLNMISTADGRASLAGRSGAIGGRADRELFHGLRTAVDAVMAGAGTVRAERYRRLVRNECRREIRRERGFAEEPLACIVSGRLALSCEIPLLADPDARVAIVTTSAASLPRECRAEIEYVRAERAGALDLPSAMSELCERFGIRTLLCEGGPHLNVQLLAAGLVDELFLSLSPRLAGGDATSGSLRILSGPELDPPVALELVAALEHDSHLFLRYRVART
ncbi:MAG TPA: dihydrofolate reductase family protein [Solirubrobacteraceae bacterium]|nr:dihydrofolate reductase family protein [Solirubrobacteraceae bacterium]